MIPFPFFFSVVAIDENGNENLRDRVEKDYSIFHAVFSLFHRPWDFIFRVVSGTNGEMTSVSKFCLNLTLFFSETSFPTEQTDANLL